MLTVKLAGREQHMHQLLALVVTYFDRIQRILTLSVLNTKH